MLCNICFLWITTSLGIDAINDPFTGNATIAVQQSDIPNIYNATNPSGTTFDSIANPTNSSDVTQGGNGNPLFFVDDYFQIPFTVLFYIIEFLSGGFIFNAITVIGFPTYIATGIQTIIAFWGIYTLIYYFTGKG